MQLNTEEIQEINCTDFADLVRQLGDDAYPKDTKLFYRDADETICVVSDEQDFYEARLQQQSGTKIKLFVAKDATSANVTIPNVNPNLANSMVIRMLDETVVSEDSQFVCGERHLKTLLTDSQIEANV